MASRVGGASTAATAAASTVAVTYTPTANNGVLAVIGWDSATVTCTSVTHTNCTWSLLKRYQANGCTVEVWYCASVGASPGGTITFNLSASQAGRMACVEEYDTAFASSSALEVSATGTGAGGSITTISSGTTGATAVASEVHLMGCFSAIDATISEAYTLPSSGWAITRNPTASSALEYGIGGGLIDKIASATAGSVAAQVTVAGTCDRYVATMCCIQFASAVTAKSDTDTLNVGVTEGTPTVRNSFSSSDTLAAAITEGTPTISVTLSGTDTIAVAITEGTPTVSVSLPSTDSLDVAITDTTVTTATFSSSDTLAVIIGYEGPPGPSFDELWDLTIAFADTDTLEVRIQRGPVDLGIEEIEDTLAIFPSTDSLDVVIDPEAQATIGVVLSSSDTLAVSDSESYIVGVSSSDTLAISTTETAQIAIVVTDTDTLATAIEEGGYPTSDEDLGVVLVETESIIYHLVMFDTDELAIHYCDDCCNSHPVPIDREGFLPEGPYTTAMDDVTLAAHAGVDLAVIEAFRSSTPHWTLRRPGVMRAVALSIGHEEQRLAAAVRQAEDKVWGRKTGHFATGGTFPTGLKTRS